jgi:tetratricopeptide (TPR) repeat protein
MKLAARWIGVAVVSATVGATAALLFRPAELAVQGTAAETGDSAYWGNRLADMESRQEALERAVDQLRAGLAARTGDESRRPADEIDAAIEGWMRAHMPELAVAQSGDPARVAKPGQSIDAALAKLVGPATDPAERELLLRELRAAGRIDEVIEHLESQASMAPRDAGLQVLLGQAYIEKIQSGVDGRGAGELAENADVAFDRALALDPGNAQARYTKALALTYWPAQFGKQAEAVAHFEMLTSGSSNLPKSEQTTAHLMLGNLYLQQGKKQQAIAAWKYGLTLFPDDVNLLKQLELAQGN